MHRFLSFGLAALATLSGCTAASETPAPVLPLQTPREDRGAPPPPYLLERIGRFDLDGDEKLSFEEFLDYEWSIYLRYDSNGDAALSEDEYVAMQCHAFTGQTFSSGKSMYDSCSRSASRDFPSSKVSIGKDAIRRKSLRAFKISDRNRDGYISASDY